ncbi:hypothetical protein [Flavobacterium sp. ZS1P14]
MNTIKNFVAPFSTVINYNTISDTTINELMRRPFAPIVKNKE